MLGNLTGWHLLVVLAIVLLLFGAPKLPGLARSVGQSMRIFRSEVKTMKDENADDAASDVVDDETDEPEPKAAATKPAARKTTATRTTAATKPKP